MFDMDKILKQILVKQFFKTAVADCPMQPPALLATNELKAVIAAQFNQGKHMAHDDLCRYFPCLDKAQWIPNKPCPNTLAETTNPIKAVPPKPKESDPMAGLFSL